MAKAIAKSSTNISRANAKRTPIEMRATWGDCHFAGIGGAGDRLYRFLVTAGIPGACLYSGVDDWDREQTVRTALLMLRAAAALEGLTVAERAEMREIAASTHPLFGPRSPSSAFSRLSTVCNCCGLRRLAREQDPKSALDYLGHEGIQHTAGYTELPADGFKDFRR